MTPPFPSPRGSAAYEIEDDGLPLSDPDLAVAEIHYALTVLVKALIRLGPKERMHWIKQTARSLGPLTERVAELTAEEQKGGVIPRVQ